ncbi:MAG: NTP transferase domain-containing protein [Gemmatimonadota bacterium]
MIAGIVLAAGRSTRMGAPKGLLPVGESTFIEHALAVLRAGGCDPVIAVVPPGTAAGALGDLVRSAGGRAVENPSATAEQVDSLRLGLAAADAACQAAVVLPVDFPRGEGSTVRDLVEAFRARGAPIVRPVHAGRPGHPVLFARRVWAELGAPQLAGGARSVVDRYRAEIEEVSVTDGGVVNDVDSPADYQREVPGA